MRQTNFSASFYKTLPLYRLCHKRANCFSIITVLMALFITACSTQPSINKIPTTKKTVVEEETNVKQTETAEDKLILANTLNEQSITIEQQQEVNELLIEASELFLQEQNYTKALWLANQVSDLVQNEADVYRLLLVKAASLHALNYPEEAYQQLTLAEELVQLSISNNADNQALSLNYLYYQTLSDVLLTKAQYAQSASAQLFAFSMNETATEEDAWLIWQKLITLTPWQLKHIAKNQPPAFGGWQQLLRYSQKYGTSPDKLSRYLSLWQQNHPTHAANIVAAELSNTMFEVNLIENIAVLLPLSGSQAGAGLAAQQGILAAYKNSDDININFIDTNALDWDNLPVQFTELNIDHVIGPLLKSHVENYLTLSEAHEALQIPSLLLNLPQSQKLTANQSALSMSPEDEAKQAATVLSQQNYLAPIILSHQDKVSKRIAVAFSEQWQQSTGKIVDIVYFNQGKQMQTSLKESLDVNASQVRINQLTSRLKQTIKTETRNRRDIDMIYLVGSASQTRLIKPYIDVNISPFAKVIPVYASSRSHSHFNDINNSSSITDLQNLTFTQMPWLLDSKQQNKSLAQLSQNLWPKRTDSLSRIFAMGFDSYQLLPKISLMKQAPYNLHAGQTGTLQLNENNILTRSLIWGRYQNDKVTEIVMD